MRLLYPYHPWFLLYFDFDVLVVAFQPDGDFPAHCRFDGIFAGLCSGLVFDRWCDRTGYNRTVHGNSFDKYESVNGNAYTLFHIKGFFPHPRSALISAGTTGILKRLRSSAGSVCLAGSSYKA